VAKHLERIDKPGVETLLIEDALRGVFLLNRLGWHEGTRVDNIVIYARIKDSKVWIEEDNTDLCFADALLRDGIPREDIVLAFQPPESRHMTEFAVA
jgi:hypothetical protein